MSLSLIYFMFDDNIRGWRIKWRKNWIFLHKFIVACHNHFVRIISFFFLRVIFFVFIKYICQRLFVYTYFNDMVCRESMRHYRLIKPEIMVIKYKNKINVIDWTLNSINMIELILCNCKWLKSNYKHGQTKLEWHIQFINIGTPY